MDRLEKYIEEHSLGEDALLAELDRVTNLRVVQPKMVSGRVQGAFLRLMAGILQPQFVLEIGTFTGYSALSIAAGMGEQWERRERPEQEEQEGQEEQEEQEGQEEQEEQEEQEGQRDALSNDSGRQQQPAQLHTVEIDDELEDLARSFFDRSPHGHKIHLHIGSALEVVPKLIRRLERENDGFAGFDMVFIDGDKREYPDYYRMLMGDGGDMAAMVRPGGVILADNVLWYGKVAEPELIKASDKMSQGIVEFNRIVAGDPRVENVILPLRDGINMIRVK